MAEVTCQYTGLKFNGSARSKNHPVASKLLNEAYKRGNYSEVVRLLEDGRKLGLTTPEAFETHVRDGLAKAQARRDDTNRRAWEAEKEAERQRAEAKAQREAQNAHLKAHGYKWSKNYSYDFDSYEEPGTDYRWELSAPDGRVVSVEQALDEIERGADVVQAELAAKKAEAEEATRQAEERRLAIERERVELAQRVSAMTNLQEQHDWSWDDYRFSVEATIAESEHWAARQYWNTWPERELLGFVIEKKERQYA